MKVRCVNANGYESILREGAIYEGELKFVNSIVENRWEIVGIEGKVFFKSRFKQVKELTFPEVIANIKEGETWVNDTAPIKFIRLRANGALDFSQNEGINVMCKYRLERRFYSFTEAFKAFEKGKEIENSEGWKFKIDGDEVLVSKNSGERFRESITNGLFSLKEMREDWYINE